MFRLYSTLFESAKMLKNKITGKIKHRIFLFITYLIVIYSASQNDKLDAYENIQSMKSENDKNSDIEKLQNLTELLNNAISKNFEEFNSSFKSDSDTKSTQLLNEEKKDLEINVDYMNISELNKIENISNRSLENKQTSMKSNTDTQIRDSRNENFENQTYYIEMNKLKPENVYENTTHLRIQKSVEGSTKRNKNFSKSSSDTKPLNVSSDLKPQEESNLLSTKSIEEDNLGIYKNLNFSTTGFIDPLNESLLSTTKDNHGDTLNKKNINIEPEYQVFSAYENFDINRRYSINMFPKTETKKSKKTSGSFSSDYEDIFDITKNRTKTFKNVFEKQDEKVNLKEDIFDELGQKSSKSSSEEEITISYSIKNDPIDDKNQKTNFLSKTRNALSNLFNKTKSFKSKNSKNETMKIDLQLHRTLSNASSINDSEKKHDNEETEFVFKHDEPRETADLENAYHIPQLTNTRQTMCYANSAFQALNACSSFKKIVKIFKEREDMPNIYRTMYDFFVHMYWHKYIYSDKYYFQLFKEKNLSKLNILEQQDVSEFLLALFDDMTQGSEYEKNLGCLPFYTEQHCVEYCRNCNKYNKTHIIEYIPIIYIYNNNLSILDQIKAKLIENNSINEFTANKCCNKPLKSEKEFLYGELPPLMILMIERYAFDKKEKTTKKCPFPIDVPLGITIRKRNWELKAVILHFDDSDGNAHYKVIVKILKKFFLCDDTEINQLCRVACSLSGNLDAYLCFYEELGNNE